MKYRITEQILGEERTVAEFYAYEEDLFNSYWDDWRKIADIRSTTVIRYTKASDEWRLVGYYTGKRA